MSNILKKSSKYKIKANLLTPQAFVPKKSRQEIDQFKLARTLT